MGVVVNSYEISKITNKIYHLPYVLVLMGSWSDVSQHTFTAPDSPTHLMFILFPHPAYSSFFYKIILGISYCWTLRNITF